MEDNFMNFASAMAAHDAEFTGLTTTNVNMYTQLRQKEDNIRSLKSELYNLKVAEETQTNEVKGTNRERKNMYVRKNRNRSVQMTQRKEMQQQKLVLVAWL